MENGLSRNNETEIKQQHRSIVLALFLLFLDFSLVPIFLFMIFIFNGITLVFGVCGLIADVIAIVVNIVFLSIAMKRLFTRDLELHKAKRNMFITDSH